jgi:prepilin-type N-terminal cleavage/methylation domain-containing protein
MTRTKQKGFTLIELLVAVAIIGMLLSVIMVSFGNSRLKSRDGKRISDMKQIRNGLEIFFSMAQGYPDPAVWNSLQSNYGLLTCDGVEAFRVPNDVVPGYTYSYNTNGTALSSCTGTVWSDFVVIFNTEGVTELGPPGSYYMSQKGFTSAPPW